MLLEIHALGLGGIWFGEILNRHKEVEKVMNVPEGCELMVVIALGKPKKKNQTSERKNIQEIMLK